MPLATRSFSLRMLVRGMYALDSQGSPSRRGLTHQPPAPLVTVIRESHFPSRALWARAEHEWLILWSH